MSSRIAKILGLVGFTSWAASDPGWESILSSLVALAVWIEAEMSTAAQLAQPQPTHPHDVALFAKLQKVLPPQAVLQISHHDFGSAFGISTLHPLFEFVDGWIDIGHEFHDPVVEARRIDLMAAASAFTRATGDHTFPTGSNGSQKVYPDPHMIGTVKREEAVALINDRARAVHLEYRQLIQDGRARLEHHTATPSDVE